MKGTSFQKPLEFNLRVDGESWQQGDAITGTLVVKNHGSEPISMSDLRVHLADGELKKVRLKSPEAFEILQSAQPSSPNTIAPQKEGSFPWTFQTDRNYPITDTGSSPFLLYGTGDAIEKLAQLQLPMHPEALIQEFLKAIEIQFRFVRKTQKSSKGWVEIKLAPPDAKGFATLENLVLAFRFEGDNLEVKYVFNIKKIEAAAASITSKKEKREARQTFAPHQYRLPSGRWNHEVIEASIRDALETVESKIVF